MPLHVCEVSCAEAGGRKQASSLEDVRGQPTPSNLWHEATTAILPTTAEWTNKVELADLDGDGRIDLLFANGGNYSEPGEPEPNRAFLNRRPARPFGERNAEVFGPAPDVARVIKARDFDGDGDTEIFVGATLPDPEPALPGHWRRRLRGTDGHPASAASA